MTVSILHFIGNVLWIAFCISVIVTNSIQYARYEKPIDLLGLSLGAGLLCAIILKELKDGE